MESIKIYFDGVKTELTDVGMNYLAQAFCKLELISDISLRFTSNPCTITDAGVNELAIALENCHYLENFNLDMMYGKNKVTEAWKEYFKELNERADCKVWNSNQKL